MIILRTESFRKLLTSTDVLGSANLSVIRNLGKVWVGIFYRDIARFWPKQESMVIVIGKPNRRNKAAISNFSKVCLI